MDDDGDDSKVTRAEDEEDELSTTPTPRDLVRALVSGLFSNSFDVRERELLIDACKSRSASNESRPVCESLALEGSPKPKASIRDVIAAKPRLNEEELLRFEVVVLYVE